MYVCVCVCVCVCVNMYICGICMDACVCQRKNPSVMELNYLMHNQSPISTCGVSNV